MKQIFLVLLLFGGILIIKAQLKLEIMDLDLYNIQLGTRPKVFSPDGKYELLTTRSHESTKRDSPYIKISYKIVNDGDTIVRLPLSVYSRLITSYRFNNKDYTIKMLVNDGGGSAPLEWDGDYRLIQPKEYLKFGSADFLIPERSELAKETKDVKDFSSFMIKILPTLRFQYRTYDDLVINQDSILNVTIKELQPAQYLP